MSAKCYVFACENSLNDLCIVLCKRDKVLTLRNRTFGTMSMELLLI
jgi:hypothetical protein